MHWRSRLIHSRGTVPEGFRSLVPATHRGSTVVFDTQQQVSDDWEQHQAGYTYGVFGTPTTLELASRIAELEGAQHTFLTPGGQAAIALIYLAFCSSGSHVLLPGTAYGPSAELGRGLLHRLSIDVELYEPGIGAAIRDHIRPETTLIWCESPGSITMEIQDVPAIVRAAHERGIPVALDNTYAAGVLFDAFHFGVDVSMQALTKYIGGHSDLLLGSVSAGTANAYRRLGETHNELGMAVSPDDCSLALRGLQTLAVRLDALQASTLAIAAWLSKRPEIQHVLHPALAGSPGHDLWLRDFTGSASVFSIVFQPGYTPEQVVAFVNALRLFKIGWSWGGVTSLVMAYPTRPRVVAQYGGRLVRLNIGLEHTADLIADLASALQAAPPSILGKP